MATKKKPEKAVVINPDRDQFITSVEAAMLQARLMESLFDAKSPFGVVVQTIPFFQTLAGFVQQDEPGEELYYITWGGVCLENSGLFAAYSRFNGFHHQVSRSLIRMEKKGAKVPYWVKDYFLDRIEKR